MSGNPFRRVQSHHVADTSTSVVDTAPPYEQSPASDVQHDSYSVVTPTRPRSESKAKKTVRIRSPEFSPISPDYTRTAPLPDYRTAVPPPPPAAFKNASPTPPEATEAALIDPFESRFPTVQGLAIEDEEGQLLQNTRRNSGNPSVEEQAKDGVPNNPFSRTLATMEAGIASVVPQPQDTLKLAKLDDALPSKPEKPAMDVDSFTRMLMTGKTDAPIAQTRSQNQSPAVESNSNMDLSSISRQSTSDTLRGPSTDSPRTSSELSDAEDEETSAPPHDGNAAVFGTGTAKKPPPPPKHRHGKSVTSKAPQTVSFDDFTASLTQNLPNVSPNRPMGDAGGPLSSSSLSGSSKPSANTTAPSDRGRTPTAGTGNPLAEPVEIIATSSQKKIPPPVPLARRQSQMKPQPRNRSRSNSALTTESQEGSSYPPSIAESTSSSSKPLPPPPPPTRRQGIHNSTPSVTDTPGSPPSHSALAQALTSSQQSSRSNLSSPPPPPPPRPRRSSGRSSLDQARDSADFGRGSFESSRRSIDSASAIASPIEETPQRNILADMEAFQREIDELRTAQDKH